MLRHLTLCLTVAAALQPPSAAAEPASEDAPVSAAAMVAARRLGLDLVRDRARFVPELARLLHGPPNGQRPPLDPLFEPEPGVSALAPVLVPVPLSAAVWSEAVFRRQVTRDDLIETIMADREAALLARGLAALDDETLGFLAEAPDLLALLYERGAAAFAAFGSSLAIRANQVVPPGGADAVPLWEAVVGERVRDARPFVTALFTRSRGRLAYLYDLIAALDPPRAAFALGTWIEDAGVRRDRFRALAALCVRSYSDWRLEVTPFVRPPSDLSFMLLRVRVGASGAPEPPSSRAFWREAINSHALVLTDRQRAGVGDDASEPIDAAWLAEIATGDLYGRADRLDQFAFGQRAFGGAPPEARADVLVAVRAFPRQRMLMLTLERMGIRAPALYATVARQAAKLSTGDASRAFWRLAQVQSALAILARLHDAGTLDTAAAASLVTSLLGVSVDDGRYRGAIVGWVEEPLAAYLPEGETIDDRVTAGLAGPVPGNAAPRVAWEGQDYRLDFAAAEARRLRAVRERQGVLPLAVAGDLHRVARRLQTPAITADDLQGIRISLAAIGETFQAAPNRAAADLLPAGVERPREGVRTIADTLREVEQLTRGGDPRRAARLAPPLLDVADGVAGTALLSLAYAVHLGPPDGAPLLADNVALRHDFGFNHPDAEMRARTPWAVPRQTVQPGVPWHVSGSVLGLDIALAPLVLRRIRLDRLAGVPRLRSNEREAFAVSVALMRPRTLHDADRDAIAAAVARGRGRIDALADGEEDLSTLTRELALDGWRRRAIGWTIDHEPARLSSAFSLVELLALGGATGRDLSAWGASGLHLEGCACTRLSEPRQWRLLGGRPQSAFLVVALADLNLRVALSLAERRLPSALARPVLAAAVQDFIDEAGPSDYDDWLTLVRAAQSLSPERIEDYVAVAAAVDGPLIPIAEAPASRP